MNLVDRYILDTSSSYKEYIDRFEAKYDTLPDKLPNWIIDYNIPFPDPTTVEMNLTEDQRRLIISHLSLYRKYVGYSLVRTIRRYPMLYLELINYNWLIPLFDKESIPEMRLGKWYYKLYDDSLWLEVDALDDPERFIKSLGFPSIILLAEGEIFLLLDNSVSHNLFEPQELRLHIPIEQDMSDIITKGFIPLRYMSQYEYNRLYDIVIAEPRYLALAILGYHHEINPKVMILIRLSRLGIDPILDILDMLPMIMDDQFLEPLYLESKSKDIGITKGSIIDNARLIKLHNLLSLIPADFCKGRDIRKGVISLEDLPYLKPRKLDPLILDIIDTVSNIRNVIVSGGLILSLFDIEYDPSDIDIFIYGPNYRESLDLIFYLLQKIGIRPDIVEVKGSVIQFEFDGIKIQIITTQYLTASQVIYSFDLSHTMGFIQNSKIYLSPYMIIFLLGKVLTLMWPIVSDERVDKAKDHDDKMVNPFTGVTIVSYHEREPSIYERFNLEDAIKIITPSKFSWTATGYGSSSHYSNNERVIITNIYEIGLYIAVDDNNLITQILRGKEYKVLGTILYE